MCIRDSRKIGTAGRGSRRQHYFRKIYLDNICQQLGHDLLVEIFQQIVTNHDHTVGSETEEQSRIIIEIPGEKAVSYTHLDVYKRQGLERSDEVSPEGMSSSVVVTGSVMTEAILSIRFSASG